MPTYFFDVDDDGSIYTDNAGIELDDDREARDQAIGLLPDLARDVMPNGDSHDIIVTARNDDGETVYIAKLALEGRWRPVRP